MANSYSSTARIRHAHDEYIKRRVAGECPVNLRELAQKHRVAWGSLKNRASPSKDAWEEEALAEIERRDKIVQAELAKSHAEVVGNIRKRFSIDLEEMFERHLRISRGLVGLGLKRLNMVSEGGDKAIKEELGVRDAKNMVFAGKLHELKIAELAKDLLAAANSVAPYSPQEQADHQRAMRELSEEFLRFAKEKRGGSGSTDQGTGKRRPRQVLARR